MNVCRTSIAHEIACVLAGQYTYFAAMACVSCISISYLSEPIDCSDSDGPLQRWQDKHIMGGKLAKFAAMAAVSSYEITHLSEPQTRKRNEVPSLSLQFLSGRKHVESLKVSKAHSLFSKSREQVGFLNSSARQRLCVDLLNQVLSVVKRGHVATTYRHRMPNRAEMGQFGDEMCGNQPSGEPMMRRYLREAFCPEDPQTPPVPQDEDKREPMFVHAHDPDYVPEPVYPEYISLEDEHVFPAEDQPLPPVDSPTAESPTYITELDPEEDPEEYEDDEIEDGPVDYPMDGRDDREDDNGDSSGDDADDEDEDDENEEGEEEEEHLAPPDSTIVVPTDEPVSPPKGTKPAIPPPSTDITIGARITTLKIASTQALIDVVTAALPSPPLPPSLYIPPPVNRSRFKIRESSTARPIRGQGVDYGFVSTVDAEARWQGISEVGYGIKDTWVDPAEAVPAVAPMTMGEVNTRVIELAEIHKHDTHDLYALLEDAQDSRSRISHRVDMDSQRVDLLMGDSVSPLLNRSL
ncbi:hypothetical protein Tco_0806422 [Tanacetum coccineum]